MQSNALTQHYVINGCQPNSIQTGVEQEYGNYTYSIKTEHNIQKIVAIVDRYLPTDYNGIKLNPQRIVIYQTFDNNGNKPLYGIIDINKLSINHTKFGFEFKPTSNVDMIRVGNSIPKGTVLYDTPAKDNIGNYMMGRDLNTVYSSLEGTIEDSILISKEIVPYFKTKVYATRTIELGEKDYPLNLYGSDEIYKIMPDIGEYCKPTGNAYSGIIMAKREYRPELLPITFTKTKTRIYDPINDTPLDGNGSNARVVDIIVYKQNKAANSLAPEVMQQIDKYADAYLDFCNRILKEYRIIQSQNQWQAEFTDEFDQLIRHCMAMTNEPLPDEKLQRTSIQKVTNFNRKLDNVVITVVTEVEKELGPGFKVTDWDVKYWFIKENSIFYNDPSTSNSGMKTPLIAGNTRQSEIEWCLALRDNTR